MEIKDRGHDFDDADCERMLNYVYAFREFFASHQALVAEFPHGWRIDLIADGVKLARLSNRALYEGFIEKTEVVRTSWVDFLHRAKTSHELFLNVSERVLAAPAARRDAGGGVAQ